MSDTPERTTPPDEDFIRLIMEVGSTNAIAVAMETYEIHYNNLYDELRNSLRDLVDKQTALEGKGEAMLLKELEPYTSALQNLPKVHEGQYLPLVVSKCFPVDTRGFPMDTFTHVTVQIRQVVRLTSSTANSEAWLLNAPVLLTPEMQALQGEFNVLVKTRSQYYKDLEEVSNRLKPEQLDRVKRQAEANLGRVALNRSEAGRVLLGRLTSVKALPGAKPLLTVKE